MKNIAKALAVFHEHVKPVTKDKTNPHYKSRYATLDSILDEIKEPLKKANLTFAQLPLESGKLRTVLMECESGETIESTMDIMLTKSDPQAQGSALTYARRYALCAILGIATDEDDDGNAASAVKASAQPVTQQQATKSCNVCAKPHTGPYATCIECYRKKQANQ